MYDRVTQSEQALEYQTVKDYSGSGPATEEMRKPFGGNS